MTSTIASAHATPCASTSSYSPRLRHHASPAARLPRSEATEGPAPAATSFHAESRVAMASPTPNTPWPQSACDVAPAASATIGERAGDAGLEAALRTDDPGHDSRRSKLVPSLRGG